MMGHLEFLLESAFLALFCAASGLVIGSIMMLIVLPWIAKRFTKKMELMITLFFITLSVWVSFTLGYCSSFMLSAYNVFSR